MKNGFLLLSLALVLTACMGGAKKDVQYLSQKDLGLVVMKVNFKGMVRPKLEFRKFDPETGEVLRGSVIIEAPDGSVKSGPYGKMPTGDYFVEAVFEPGHWFLYEGVTYSLRGFNARTMSYDSYSAGSFGFEVKPGAVHYVGAFELAKIMAAADWVGLPQDYVSDDFSYTVSSVLAEPAYAVTFECPRSMSIVGRPGCDLGRITGHEGKALNLTTVSWKQNGAVRPVHDNSLAPAPIK